MFRPVPKGGVDVQTSAQGGVDVQTCAQRGGGRCSDLCPGGGGG